MMIPERFLKWHINTYRCNTVVYISTKYINTFIVQKGLGDICQTFLQKGDAYPKALDGMLDVFMNMNCFP